MVLAWILAFARMTGCGASSSPLGPYSLLTLNDLNDVQKVPHPNNRKAAMFGGGVQLFSGFSSHV
jgi:hypothetical protein